MSLSLTENRRREDGIEFDQKSESSNMSRVMNYTEKYRGKWRAVATQGVKNVEEKLKSTFDSLDPPISPADLPAANQGPGNRLTAEIRG